MYRYVKSASITATALGTIVNFALAVQVLTASRSLKWEPESEWEASSDTWQIDGVKVIWGLCCAYFTLAAVVCIVGFTGILRRKPALVRFYRDYSIADFSFCTFVSVIATYAMFHASNRAALCEELSHHPELLQNLTDMGLTLENCERWLEGAGFAFVAVMFVLLVIRLHFLLAVANFYSIFSKQAHLYSRSPSHLHFDDLHATQRIYLLPPSDEESRGGDDVELVYAPVPISSIPKHLRDSATEAWVSCNAPSLAESRCHSRARSGSESHAHACEQLELDQQQQHSRPHRHRRHSHSHSCGHSHRHSRSSSASRTGTIRLPVLPDEGLFPDYSNTSKA